MQTPMLAIDVSSETLQGCHQLPGQSFEKGPTFFNDEGGIAQAVAWAKERGAWIVMEATGAYHLPLAIAAQEAGVSVAPVRSAPSPKRLVTDPRPILSTQGPSFGARRRCKRTESSSP